MSTAAPPTLSAAELQGLYDSVARFAREEIAPHVTDWDAAGEFPRALYRRAAELGLLAIGYPEHLGGTPAGYAMRLPVWVALCRHGGSGGVLASLFSHNIGLPPIVAHGSARSVKLAAQARGLDYEAPYEGGRLRPDGAQLRWRNARARSQDLPFLCGDITPRKLRVPEGELRQHANHWCLGRAGDTAEILGTQIQGHAEHHQGDDQVDQHQAAGIEGDIHLFHAHAPCAASVPSLASSRRRAALCSAMRLR